MSAEHVDDLMAKARGLMQGKDVDGQIVAVCEDVLAYPGFLGLLIENVVIHPMSVGVHYNNRYGQGIKANFMDGIGSQIFRSGFRWTACSDAICMEEDDDGKIGKFT